MFDAEKVNEIVTNYHRDNVGYDTSMELLMAMGIAEVRADRMLMAKYVCSCGRRFESPTQLRNHIGYAILNNGNEANHKEVTK